MRETERDLPWIDEGLRLSGPARLDGEKGYAMLHTTQHYLYTGHEEPLALTWYPYNGGAVLFDDCKIMPAAVTYVDDDKLIIDTPDGRKEITRETEDLAVIRWADDMYIAATIRRAEGYASQQKDRVLSWIRGENVDDLARSLTYMILDYIDGREPEDNGQDQAVEVACVLLAQDGDVIRALTQAEYIA